MHLFEGYTICLWNLNWNCRFSLVCLQILYNQQSVEVQGNLKRKLITQLQPDTDYSFVLTSRGNIAGGLQQQVSIRTAPDLIQTRPIYTTHQAQGGKMTINLPKVQTTTRVRSVRTHIELNTKTSSDSRHESSNIWLLFLTLFSALAIMHPHLYFFLNYCNDQAFHPGLARCLV